MNNKDNRPGEAAELRRRAEEAARSSEDLETLSPEDTRRILHELRVHQIELEMQNEELRRAQVELGAARARYFDLYDLAPVGYVTLSEQGLFVETNLTAATLLGVNRSALVKQPVSRFILEEDHDIYYRHRKRLFETGAPQACDLRMVNNDGTAFWARLEATTAQDADGAPVCRLVLSDITEPKRAEAALRESREAYRALVETRAEAALRESKETYRALVETLPDIVIRFDRGGRHLFVSDNVRDVVDLQAAQFIGKTHRELGFPDAQCRVWEETVRNVFDSGSPFETEYRFEGKRGPVIYNWRLVPDRDAQGVVRSVLSLSRDITAQRRAEEDYRTLFREMLDGFALYEIICDEHAEAADYRFLAINPAFERMTGLKAEDVVGRTVLEVMPGIEPPRIETYGKVALTGEPAFFEDHSTERKRDFQVTAFRPAPNQFACILSDITERKHADLAMRESEQRFRFAVHSTAAGYFRLDAEGRWEDVNDAWLAIHGYQDRAEVIGRPFALTQVDEDLYAAGRIVARLLSGEGVPSGEFSHRRKDGTVGHHTYSVGPIVHEGRAVGAEGFIIDITDRRRTEAALNASQEQLRHAQKMEAVGRLAGGVAHDFNNMLTAILGYSSYLLDGLAPDAPLRGPISEIQKAGQRAAALTRHLLAFSRKQVLSPAVLDVGQVIADVQKMISRVIGEHIKVVCKDQPEHLLVEADRGQLEQVLLNLAVNAGDAMPGGGRLLIEARRATGDHHFAQAHLGVTPGDYVEIAVTDTGTGMTPEVLSHLFEPFFTTKAVGKGTGLGLSTVYGIVRQSNGHIVVESEVGRGSAFSVYLPRLAGSAEPDVAEPRRHVAHRGVGTVLLAEDDDAVRSFAKLVLQEMGYRVFEARDGAEARGLFDTIGAELDLLVTDVVMPVMGGHLLADCLKRQRPGLKVLYMSGYSDEAVTRLSALPPGSVFVEKPFGPGDFVEKLREALGGGTA
jgi:PAS domain S-box-containing protein